MQFQVIALDAYFFYMYFQSVLGQLLQKYRGGSEKHLQPTFGYAGKNWYKKFSKKLP